MKAKAPVLQSRAVPGGRFAGRYVALRSLPARDVLASGRSARRVLAAARRRGVPAPLVVYVPAPDALDVKSDPEAGADLTAHDMLALSASSLQKIWDTPEEDAAWANL